MPDITVWLRMQPDFPFKQNLLELDGQTLQLVVFAFLLFIILAKVYSSIHLLKYFFHFFKVVYCCYYMVLLWLYNSIDNGSNNWNNYRSYRWFTSNYWRVKNLDFFFKILFSFFFYY